MEKFRGFVRKYAVISCIIIEVLALGLMKVVQEAFDGILKLMNIQNMDSYVYMGIPEAVMVLLAVGMIFLLGQQHIFKRKTTGFFKSLLPGGYFIFITMFATVINLLQAFYKALYAAMGVTDMTDVAAVEAAATPENVLHALETMHLDPKPFYLFLAFALCMACVGMFEEFLFRGIISEMLIRRYGKDSKGILLSVVVTGVLFGCAHLINLLSAEPVGVILQAIVTSVMGMAFTAVYYRTGKIWLVAALHGMVDFGALIATGLFYDQGDVSSTISGYTPAVLVGAIPYIIVLLVILRKKKLEEIPRTMALDVKV